jgi:hypothetical protein
MDESKPPIPPDELQMPRSDRSGGLPVAVYYRNEQEVREGFLGALRAMGVAVIEQLPEPTEPPVSGAKP